MFEFFVDIIFDGNLLIASAVAMFAGLISFASPCVLPLVPGYLSYAAGMTEEDHKNSVAFDKAVQSSQVKDTASNFAARRNRDKRTRRIR